MGETLQYFTKRENQMYGTMEYYKEKYMIATDRERELNISIKEKK